MKRKMLHLMGHLAAFIGLTVSTQIGGLAYLVGLRFRHRAIAIFSAYLLLSVAAVFIAPLFGRVPIRCGGNEPLRMQSWFYCITNRNYVTPQMKAAAEDLAQSVAAAHPGTVTQALDANFPFLRGFPLLPHLSHNDGRKLDVAFYYGDESGTYEAGLTRSPIGYFAFEDGPTECPPRSLTLRWDLKAIQPLFPNFKLERIRMVAALEWLSKDPRISRVFIEPHLREPLGITSGKFRFQGCRAARHDDHFHIEV